MTMQARNREPPYHLITSLESLLWEQKMVHRPASQSFSQITEHVEPVYVYYIPVTGERKPIATVQQ